MKHDYIQKEIDYQRRASRGLTYGISLKPEDNPDRLHIASFLDYFSGSRKVLEIGCGNGRFSFLLAEMFPRCQFMSTDLYPSNIRACARVNTYANLSFLAADGLNLPFADGSFDLVAGFYILHHLPDLRRAVGEINRVLAPGGCYAGCEPNCNNPALFLRIASRINLSPNERAILPRVYRGFFEKAGWKVRFDYFFPRFPSVRHRFLSSCFSLTARRRGERVP